MSNANYVARCGLLLLAILFSAGCSGRHAASNAAGPVSADSIHRISVSALAGALQRGEALACDVRKPTAFAAGHIRGALSVPTGAPDAEFQKLPQDKLIVLYCA